MIEEIIDFIWGRYIYFYNRVTKEQVRNLLENYSNQIVVVRDNDGIKGVSFYLKLTDETFEGIKNKILDITNIDMINKCLQEKGNNIHFILLIADGVKTIINGLREIIKRENPKSISWFSPNMKNLFIRKIREVELCHQ